MADDEDAALSDVDEDPLPPSSSSSSSSSSKFPKSDPHHAEAQQCLLDLAAELDEERRLRRAADEALANSKTRLGRLAFAQDALRKRDDLKAQAAASARALAESRPRPPPPPSSGSPPRPPRPRRSPGIDLHALLTSSGSTPLTSPPLPTGSSSATAAKTVAVSSEGGGPGEIRIEISNFGGFWREIGIVEFVSDFDEETGVCVRAGFARGGRTGDNPHSPHRQLAI